MAIGYAIERKGQISVYDEKGLQLFAKPKGNGPSDGLQGYTANTVTIRVKDLIMVYDEKGLQIACRPVG